MRIDFSPPEPRYRPASLEIRDCDLSDVTENERLNDLLPVWSIEGSVIPLDFEPTKRNVTQVLIEIQRKSGFLKGFPHWNMAKRAEETVGTCNC